MTGAGRWPANVIMSPGAARQLDQQSGVLTSGAKSYKRGEVENSQGWREMEGRKDKRVRSNDYDRAADSGGASRFFLNAGYEPWELEWIYANGLRPCGAEEKA